MTNPLQDTPDTATLCGDFPVLTDEQRDQGRAFSAPIRTDCTKPVLVLDGAANIVFVNGLPTSIDA